MQENFKWSDFFMDYISEFPLFIIYARKVSCGIRSQLISEGVGVNLSPIAMGKLCEEI
jgi:hypothetical protein